MAEDNTVTISSGVIGETSGYVYGGYAKNGTAKNNKVIMEILMMFGKINIMILFRVSHSLILNLKVISQTVHGNANEGL